MILGHHLVYSLGLGPEPEGSLGEQIIHAEAMNLQMSLGSNLSHEMVGAGGFHFGMGAESLMAPEPRFVAALEGNRNFTLQPLLSPLSMMSQSKEASLKGIPTDPEKGIRKTTQLNIVSERRRRTSSLPSQPLFVTPDLEVKVAQFLSTLDPKAFQVSSTRFKGGTVHVVPRSEKIQILLLKDRNTRPFLVLQTDAQKRLTHFEEGDAPGPRSRDRAIFLLESSKHHVLFFQALIDAIRISKMREAEEAEEWKKGLASQRPQALSELRIEGPRPGEKEPRIYWLGRNAGREGENFISIPDVAVSRRHAKISVYSDGIMTLKDLNSTQGTWILRNHTSKPEKVEQIPVDLDLSDKILLGGFGAPGQAIVLKFSRGKRLLHLTPFLTPRFPAIPVHIVHQVSDLPQDKVMRQHPDGKVALLQLSSPQQRGGTEYPMGSLLEFDPEGILTSVFLSEDTLVSGIPCAGGTTVKFDEIGLLEEVTLSRPLKEGDILHPAGTRINFREELAETSGDKD